MAWDDWRHDVTAAAAHIADEAGKPLIASLRGGALLDDAAPRHAAGGASRRWTAPRWRATWSAPGLAGGVEWAGYAPSDALQGRSGGGDAGGGRAAADASGSPPTAARPTLKLDGPALWRRVRARQLRRARRRQWPPISSHGAAHAPPPELRLRGRRRSAGSLDAADGADRPAASSPAAARPGSARTECTKGSPRPWPRQGYPCFRYDRRGVGDSDGEDPGFRGSGPDLAAAAAAFRRERRRSTRVIGFGLCDGATALALFGDEAGLDGLILVNPWLVEAEAGRAAAGGDQARTIGSGCSASRAGRESFPDAVDYRKLLKGLRRIVAHAGRRALAGEIAASLRQPGCPPS